MFAIHFLYGPGAHGDEYLDRPPSNFDVGGIPQGKWSSGLFACYKNLIPSCFMSFFCPCIMFGQIVIRAQIPLLIAIKNSTAFLRSNSGYSFFINSFLLTLVAIGAFFVGGIFVKSKGGAGILFAFAALFLMFFMFVVGHVRTAFKMKYSLPSALPRGSEFWDCVIDAIVSVVFLPCALAQMARHVFQYDRWSPPLGLFYKDPYALPPLEVCRQRPLIADEAGILWTDDSRHPEAEVHTGSADRERENRRLASYTNTNISNHNNIHASAPPVAHATAATTDSSSLNQSLVYRADGTIAR